MYKKIREIHALICEAEIVFKQQIYEMSKVISEFQGTALGTDYALFILLVSTTWKQPSSPRSSLPWEVSLLWWQIAVNPHVELKKKKGGGERRNTKISSSFCNENLTSLSSVALVGFFCVTLVATLSPLIHLTFTSHSVVLMLQLHIQHIFSPNMPRHLFPSYSAFPY